MIHLKKTDDCPVSTIFPPYIMPNGTIWKNKKILRYPPFKPELKVWSRI